MLGRGPGTQQRDPGGMGAVVGAPRDGWTPEAGRPQGLGESLTGGPRPGPVGRRE